ncbi:unnamed protein product [Closterium sp. Naga37s-1]|nr:unnamed protein product [Closterium sp. Naga37s-1]
MAATSLVDALKSAALRIFDSASPAVLASAGLSNHTSDASSSWTAPATLHRATSALWSSAINRTGAGNPGSCAEWANGNGSTVYKSSSGSFPAAWSFDTSSYPSLTSSLAHAARCGYSRRVAEAQQDGILAPWQIAALACGVVFLVLARALSLTVRLRRVLQPFVTRMVEQGTATVVSVQRYRRPWLDAFMSFMAMAVSVEFYTAFLPVLFWSGRPYLASLAVLLLALCTYAGNALKDVVAAPRPLSPPAQRVTGTHMDAQSSFEFGLPSSHTINTIALSLYLLLFLLLREGMSVSGLLPLTTVVLAVVIIVVGGRLYLGMHSPIDLAAGMAIGVAMPLLLLCVDMHILHFWIHGPNVLLFHACLAVLQLFAYPTPPRPTPSYEDHNAFTGVILGLVSSYHLSLPGLGPHYLALPLPATSLSLSTAITIAIRVLIGLPLALLMKEIASAVAKLVLPLLCRALGIPVFSTRYVKGLRRVGSSMHRVGSAPGGIAGMRKAGSMLALGGVEGRSGEVEGKRPAMGSCGGGVFCEEFDEDEVVSVPWAVGGSSDVDAGAVAAAVAAGTAATAVNAPAPVPVPAAAAAAAAAAATAAGERGAREKKGLRKRASRMKKSESAVSFAASAAAHAKSTAAAAKSPAKAQAWSTFAPAKGGEAAATVAPAAAAAKPRKAVQQFDVDTGIRLCAYMCLAWSLGGLAPIIFHAVGV